MNNDNTKVCTKCKIEKPKEAFYKRAGSKDGFQSSCKDCRKDLARTYKELNYEKFLDSKRAWRERNPDYSHNWYEKNKDKVKSAAKEWRENNPERVIQNRKNWEKNNPDKKALYSSNWEKNNREKVNEKAHRRRARKYENGEFYVRRKFMKRLYASACVNCGSVYMVEADHIIPIAHGGRHSEGNLQPLCRSCNGSKGTKFMAEWKRDKNDLCQ